MILFHWQEWELKKEQVFLKYLMICVVTDLIEIDICVFPDDRLLALLTLFASIPFPSDDEPQPLQVI